MTVQLRINTDDTSTTLEIPEVYKIEHVEFGIELGLRKSINQTMNDIDRRVILMCPKDEIQSVNHGYTLWVNRALIERVSL